MLRATNDASLSSKRTVDDLVRNAKRHLQDDHFEDAELIFTKALKMDSSNLRALEGRAVSFERRGLYGRALADARDIIRAFPTRAQGYLRCGKVLRLMKRLEDAVGIYTAGLSMVSKDDNLYAELQSQFKALSSSIESKSFELPSEIIINIFRLLTDPLPLAYTSKRNLEAFRQYVKSSPNLLIHSKFKASALKSLLPTKRSISVDGPTALKNLLLAVKAGTECSIEYCGFIDCNRVEPFDLSRAISLGFFKTITSVLIQGDTSDILLAAILSKTSNLTKLSFTDVVSKYSTSVPLNLPLVTSFTAVNSAPVRSLLEVFKSREMQMVHWDGLIEHVWTSSDYANYVVQDQGSLDRVLDAKLRTKWIDIELSSPRMKIQVDQFYCEKVAIFNGYIEVNTASQIEQLYLRQCKVSDVDWTKLESLTCVWLEQCIDGLDERVLSSVAALPKLKELIICGTAILCPFIPPSVLCKVPKLKIFGLVDCSGPIVSSMEGCEHVIQVTTKAEFEFIKKKKWDIFGVAQ